MAISPARIRATRAPRRADEELARLTEGLRQARNGGFALLSYDDPAQQPRWIDALRVRLGSVEFYSLPLPDDGIGLVPRIAEVSARSGLATQPLTVLVVGGIEALDKVARERLVVNLNLMRTHLAEVAYPLLFCADAAVLDQIIHDAPDLFDRIGLWADLRGHTPPVLAAPLVLDVEAQYRATLIRRYQRVEFRGILSINKPVTLPLTDFYIPLQADQALLVPDIGKEYIRLQDGEKSFEMPKRFVKETRTLAVADAIRNNRALVVLGDPGAGKTTLLRYLALSAAEGQPERAGLPAHESSWLPLLIPCATLDRMLQDTPERTGLDALTSYLEQQYEIEGIADLVQPALEQGRALLLFDGLDEIAGSERRVAIARMLDELLRTWLPRGNRVVASSRIVGYRAAPLNAANTEVTLRDFDEPQIAAFLRGWCVAYEQFARGDIPEAQRDGERQAELLTGEIESNLGARRLAGNPLLLTIMALIQRQGVRLPERRVELYDIAVRTLIETWNRARSLSDVALLNLPDPRLTAALLSEVALWMQQRGITTATAGELLPVLAEAHRRRSSPEPEAAAAAFLHDVQHYSGLLVERGPDAYSFLHLTFQEYFAARALADMSDADARWRILEPHLRDPRWRETILLTAGELGVMKRREAEVTDLVRRMLGTVPTPPWTTWWRFGKSVFATPYWYGLTKLGKYLTEAQIERIEERYLQRRLLLAGHMLADDPGVDRSVGVRVVEALVRLVYSPIELQRKDVAALLKRLPEHLRDHAARQLIDGLRSDDWRKRAAAIEALGKLGNVTLPVADTLLAALHDPDANIRSAGADALGNFASAAPAVLDALLVALHDPEWSVRSAAARALGNFASTAPVALDTLLAALHDPKWSIRSVAADALGNFGNAEPAVLDALLAALHDPDADVRLAAARALGKLGTAAPAVVDALLAALHDPALFVRSAAARAVGNFGRATPAALDALLAALHDPQEFVRSAAVDALGNFGSAAPAALDALLGALHDPEWLVRWAVADALGNLGSATPMVLDALRAALHNWDWDTRVAVAEALAKLNSNTREVRLVLLAEIDYDSAFRADSAYTALMREDEPAP